MDKVLSEIKVQNAKFDSQNAKFDSQISMIKWIVSGIGFAVLAAVIKYVFFS